MLTLETYLKARKENGYPLTVLEVDKYLDTSKRKSKEEKWLKDKLLKKFYVSRKKQGLDPKTFKLSDFRAKTLAPNASTVTM